MLPRILELTYTRGKSWGSWTPTALETFDRQLRFSLPATAWQTMCCGFCRLLTTSFTFVITWLLQINPLCSWRTLHMNTLLQFWVDVGTSFLSFLTNIHILHGWLQQRRSNVGSWLCPSCWCTAQSFDAQAQALYWHIKCSSWPKLVELETPSQCSCSST